MLDSAQFVRELSARGYAVGSGVPCSWLDGLTNALLNEPNFNFVTAAQEGEAVAIAAGADLAGRKALATMQGSGLTNAGSPLTSYNYTFKRGVLLFVSLRDDEPQHELMGRITAEQLDLWEIEHEVLSPDAPEAERQLDGAGQTIERGKSFAFIVHKGTFAALPLKRGRQVAKKQSIAEETAGAARTLSRRDILKKLLPWRDQGTVLLATTGYTGRELFSLGDHDAQLYMVGSMGCVSSLALGAALAAPERKFIAIDGDGALLMRLGSLATNAWQAPANLLHLLLDNGAHESTGGQLTASRHVDFLATAAACGYPRVVTASTLKDFKQAVEAWHKNPVLTFLYVRTRLGESKDLPRPDVAPAEKARRLRKLLASA
jgi:phosphonopyruvate decarboxylase